MLFVDGFPVLVAGFSNYSLFYRISSHEATGTAFYFLAGIYIPGWISQLCMDAAFIQGRTGTKTGKHGALYNIGCITI